MSNPQEFPPNARHGNIVFKSMADRATYVTHTLTKDKPKWLITHSTDWKLFEEPVVEPVQS
jgi:hypothetical protein